MYEYYFFCRSGLLDLIHTWNKDVGQFYEDRINEQKKLYSERLDITYYTNIPHAFIANHMCKKSSDIEYCIFKESYDHYIYT